MLVNFKIKFSSSEQSAKFVVLFILDIEGNALQVDLTLQNPMVVLTLELDKWLTNQNIFFSCHIEIITSLKVKIDPWLFSLTTTTPVLKAKYFQTWGFTFLHRFL